MGGGGGGGGGQVGISFKTDVPPSENGSLLKGKNLLPFTADPFKEESCKAMNITKTCLYNFDPLKPHFYIVKPGFTRVYIILLISVQNIDCGTR